MIIVEGFVLDGGTRERLNGAGDTVEVVGFDPVDVTILELASGGKYLDLMTRGEWHGTEIAITEKTIAGLEALVARLKEIVR